MKTRSPIRSPISSRTAFLLTLALAAIVLFPTIFWPFDYDQGTFAYGGWAVLHGLRPYIDFWDIKPPNIFYTYAAAFALFGNSVRAVRIFDYLNALLSIALLYALSLRLWKSAAWSPIAASLSAFVYVLQYYIFGHWNTAQTETYSIPLLLGAVLLLVPTADEPNERGVTIVRCLFAGAFVGVSFYFKFPNAIYLLLLVACIWVYVQNHRWKTTAYLVVGFLLAVGLESFYLGLSGELLPLWKLSTSETASYVASNYSGSFTVLRNVRTSLEALDWLWIAAATLGWIVWGRRSLPEGTTRAAFFLLLLAGFLSLAVVQAENKGYTYHYAILLPWADLWIGAGIAQLAVAISRRIRVPSAVGIATLLVLLLVFSSYLWSSENPLHSRIAELIDVARGLKAPNGYIAGDSIPEFIDAHTGQRDRIFIFGFQPYVYWKAERKPASKFINTIHFKSTPVEPWERDELVHDLTGNPPALFLVETQDRYTSQGNSDADSRSTIQLRYPELEQLLDAEYRPEDTIEGTIIYRYDGLHR